MTQIQEIERLRSLLATGQRQAAADLARTLAERFPSDEGIAQTGVDALIQCGEIASALRLAQQSAEQHGAASRFRYGRLLRESGQAQAALGQLQKAQAEGFEPETELLLQRALAHADLRQEVEALAVLEELLSLEPNHQLAQFNRATLCQAAGRADEAEQLFRQILERDPTFSEALARILYGRRMTDADRAVLRRAEKRARSQITPPLEKEGLQFALAKAYDDLGDHDGAMTKARVANEMQARRIGPYEAKQTHAFVDQMMRLVTPEWLAQPISDVNFRPIFIVGHFRSGSTLTEQVISGHPATRSLGEIDFFLRLWFEDTAGFLDLFDPGQESRLQELAGGYMELTTDMGADNLIGIDKRPENLLFMGLIRKLFPGARFIHTRRQLIDNAISIYFQQLNDLSRFATSLADFHHFDRQCQRLMGHWDERFGQAIHTVHYEELVQSPESTARSLVDFLELDWDPACLDIQSGRNFVRTASMAQVREGFHNRSVGRGRNYLPLLTEAERALFESDQP